MSRCRWPRCTEAVLEILRGHNDAVLFGAQAVNAYVDEPRMTQDVDILSVRANEVAQAIRDRLSERFHIAVRVRDVADGKGFRIFQLRKPKNRHLVDVRAVDVLPPAQRIEEVLVVTPAELIARKVIAYQQRRGKPKAGTDWRDLALLLLRVPELKTKSGPVAERLQAAGADSATIAAWEGLVAQEIMAEDEDSDF
jgi:Nucleotidyl transferase AbiEii toxin, Type IV TA system